MRHALPAFLKRGLWSFALPLALFAGGCGPLGLAVGAGAGGAVVASQERGFGRAVDDTEIRLAINDLWFKEDFDLYRAINLQVQEGRVLLSGTVADPDTRLNAVRLAWQAKGVSEVINEIEVTNKSSLVDATRDETIALQLKKKLLFDSGVQSINYSIESVNQSIYLMGVAQDQRELDRVIGHAKDIPYVRRVVNYVRLKSEPPPEG